MPRVKFYRQKENDGWKGSSAKSMAPATPLNQLLSDDGGLHDLLDTDATIYDQFVFMKEKHLKSSYFLHRKTMVNI